MAIKDWPNITGMIWTQDVNGLIDALKHDNKNVRMSAASALGQIGDIRALEALKAVRDNDKNKDVRESAIYSMKTISSIHGVPYYEQPTRKSVFNKPKVSTSKINELLDNKDIDGLNRVLKYSKDPLIRMDTALALGVLGDRKGLEYLLKALKDNDADIRANAVIALGEIGDPKAVKPLKELKKYDSDITVRTMAEHSLKSIFRGDHSIFDIPDSSVNKPKTRLQTKKSTYNDNEKEPNENRKWVLGGACAALILFAIMASMFSSIDNTTSSDPPATSPPPEASTQPATEPATPSYTTTEAIDKVKNYEGEIGWTIQDAIDSSLSLAESTGTLVITEGWSATQIDDKNFKVVYIYEEDVYGGYGDLIERTIEFEINMETNAITPLDSMADDMLGIANGN